jgi:hypothetical protein
MCRTAETEFSDKDMRKITEIYSAPEIQLYRDAFEDTRL